MYGIKFARVRTCKGCENRIDVAPPRRGAHGCPRSCDAPDGGEIELHDDFMEGPDSNCPAGYWADRISVNAEGHAERQCWPFEDADVQDCGPADDEAAFSDWNTQQNREFRRQNKKPRIKQAVRDIGDNPDIDGDRITVLATLTAVGVIPGWMADEIRNEL